MRVIRNLLGLLLTVLACQSVMAETTIESFSPQGVVKGVRQVTARFSAQMVPFGDLRLSDPFTVNCPEHGAGRWVDGSNWSYDFDRDLPAGVACSFTLKTDLKDLAGKPIGGDRDFAFSTGGPAIVRSLPAESQWSAIDEEQIFLLGLDATAKPETIEKNAYCRADGINEKIGVRLIDGKQRDEILALRESFINRHLNIYFKARGIVWDMKVKLADHRMDKLPIVVLQCKQTLPANTKVDLVWGAGITSDSGIATDGDQTLEFKTRPDFTVEFSCTRMNAQAQCIPFLPMQLYFSSPISVKSVKAIVLKGADGTVYPPSLDKEDEKREYVNNVSFKGPFPEKSSFTITLPDKLKDDAGRVLTNQEHFPLAVKTDEQPPLVKFPARFGIIEAKGDGMLPVTVRNIEPTLAGNIATVKGAMMRVDDGQDEKIISWLKRLNGDGDWTVPEAYANEMAQSIFGDTDGDKKPFTMPKPNGAQAFEVIGIPLKNPGFYVVELQSPKLGAGITLEGGTAYIQSAALVTNLSAHFKHGAESSLVWVTSLDKGLPVPDAKVAVRSCNGSVLWQGVTDKSGVARIAKSLGASGCRYGAEYFISARSGDDMTFTLSEWTGGIETWRFNVPTRGFEANNTMVNTVFDRTLFRVGETVHMKHFLRKHTQDGIRFANTSELGVARIAPYGPNDVKDGTKLLITHQGSDEQYEMPLTWQKDGTAETTWQIPAEAKQGTYVLNIGNYSAGSFRVEAFRVPTMKAILEGPAMPLVQANSFNLDVQLNYLSGGGASNAPVKVRTMLLDRALSFPDYPEFAFSNGDVKEGVEKEAPGINDEAGEWDDEGEDSGGSEGEATKVATRALTLDGHGAARVAIDNLPAVQAPRDIITELEYADANGETLTSSARFSLWPSHYVIGIRPDGWAVSKDDFKFQVAVLGLDGKPAANVPVSADFFQRNTYSHRRRLVGGFYAYENTSEIKKLGNACEGKTDDKGMLYCDVKAPDSGNLIVRAATTDADGKPAYAHRDVWVAGSGDWWFDATDSDRIDVIPEKKRYEPGQDATFQVRMPFREGTALVTVEREGIIDTYVRHLSGSKPAFSIPVKGHYAPNVYVSAFVVRGRVDDVQPTALVDLGKPAYKMGLAKIQVGWSAHELKVKVDTDREVYKTREKAKVHVKVARADGSALPANTEIALAAVDVGLLELMPNDSWNLLEAMMQERALQVETSTAQMQVIGKRHFGRKAVPHGGGGGKSAGRELFDTLLFWKARVALNANGEADVEVPLNDSLTSFRIVAIADANADLFGTGKTDIRTTQDLMLMSGLPSLVREGDQFRAGFTLRNASNAKLDVHVLGSALADTGRNTPLSEQIVTLEAGQAHEVAWTFNVPVGAHSLQWTISAKTPDGAASDTLRIRQNVTWAVPVRTYQATLMQIDKPIDMAVKAPADALPGRGGVQTLLVPKLGGYLPGVREYMSMYPYDCFEQQTSKAVALRDKKAWDALMNVLPSYLDAEGLVKYFPMMRYGSDTLTAYVLSIADEAGYEIPESSKERMEQALTGFIQGRVIRDSELRTADVAIRKMAAMEALSRSGKVATDMFESLYIEPNLWPTSAVIDFYLVLQRTPDIPMRNVTLPQVEQILRSRLNFQGTTMGFSTERNDDLWWLMISPDVNANRILLAMLPNPKWHDDIGRLVRGTLGRQHKGRWQTTVANAWGVLALEKFSKQFESEPVTASTVVGINNNARLLDWAKQPAGATFLQPWPAQGGTLSIRHSGTGKPWVTVQSLAAIPIKAPLSSGYRITRTVTPIEQKKAGTWSRGDVYRVHLDLEAQSDMTWVVVDDPIPAGASVLGNGLGRDSQVLTSGEKQTGFVWPAFEERKLEAFRSYFDFVPKGKWTVEYTVRLNNAGDFALPTTRVEAMYSPEMFGETPNANVHVEP